MFTEDLPPAELRFIESIRCVLGEPQLLPLHEKRMLRTLEAQVPESTLAKALRTRGLMHMLEPYLAELSTEHCLKLRFIYTPNEICAPRGETYTPRCIRHVHLMSLPVGASYEYKWEDRRVLEVEGMEEDEEVLFVSEGLLTDTRFSNIVLNLGGELLTPRVPLLPGVMREHLLVSGHIRLADLTPEDWYRADNYYLINAMRPLPEGLF
ncbi:MAG: aminotransferase class IV [Porphyromonadaceae bacterium]|nr:aminotransferase class IV [Porphyromonadaceae bacterium]